MTASHASHMTDAGEDHGHGTGLYIALVPWVLFTLLAQHSTLKVAAVIALVAAVAIMIRSITQGGLKLLELGAVIAFLGFTVIAFAADHATGLWLARYSRAIAAAPPVSTIREADHKVCKEEAMLRWGIIFVGQHSAEWDSSCDCFY